MTTFNHSLGLQGRRRNLERLGAMAAALWARFTDLARLLWGRTGSSGAA